jgi:hypothetical protein
VKRRGLQLSRRSKVLLYSLGLALFLSGLFWAMIHCLDEKGDATDGLRRVNPWLIAIHGFGAMGFLLVYGGLLAGHVRRAWHAQRNRRTGAFFLAFASALILSGYALYYVADEGLRTAASQFHLWLGIASPALLYWHIRSGRRAINRA